MSGIIRLSFYDNMMTVLSVIKQKRGFVDVREVKPCKRGLHITLSTSSQAIITSKSKCFLVNWFPNTEVYHAFHTFDFQLLKPLSLETSWDFDLPFERFCAVGFQA